MSMKSMQNNNSYCQFANSSSNQQMNQQPMINVYNNNNHNNNYGQPIFNLNQQQQAPQQILQSSYKMEFQSTMNQQSNAGTTSSFPIHTNKLLQQPQQESNRQSIQMATNDSINYNSMNFTFNPSNTNDNTTTAIMGDNQQMNQITMPIKKLIPNSSQQQSTSSTSPIINLELKKVKNQTLSLSCKDISQLQNSITTGSDANGTLPLSSSSSYQMDNQSNTMANIGRSLSLPLNSGLQLPSQLSPNHNKKFNKSLQQQQETGPVISSMLNTSVLAATSSSFTDVQMIPATNLAIQKHHQQQQQQHTFIQNHLSPSSSSSSPPQSSLAFDLSNSTHSQPNKKFPLLNNGKKPYSMNPNRNVDNNHNFKIKNPMLKNHTTASSSTSTLCPLDYSGFKDRILYGSMNKFFHMDNNNLSPTHDDEMIMSPMSTYGSYSLSANPVNFIGRNEHQHQNIHRERRRVCHINAEQKRRCNIKNGFDTLKSLLPSLAQNSNTKISKAAMLYKGADYIRLLKNEKFEQQKEYELLKQKIDNLNNVIRYIKIKILINHSIDYYLWIIQCITESASNYWSNYC